MDLLPRGFSSPRCREPRKLLRTPTPRGLGARGRLHTFCSASVALSRTCGQRPSRPRRATEPSPSRPSACRAVSAGLERESSPEQAGPVAGPLTPPGNTARVRSHLERLFALQGLCHRATAFFFIIQPFILKNLKPLVRLNKGN